MRHNLKRRKLNRTSSHRKSLLINLSIALIENEIIKTTLPKAKELRPFIEKLMTISKKDTLINRRSVLSVIKNKELVTKLFSDISIRIKDRDGGYTRIMHNGFRAGDRAPMAVIELVDRKSTNKEKDTDTIIKPKTKLKVEDKKQEDNLISKE